MKQLSEKARSVLNDPIRIENRDRWFARLNHLFSGEHAEYNDRHAFTLMGLREDQIIYVNPCREMSAEEAVRISGGKRIVLCCARPGMEK